MGRPGDVIENPRRKERVELLETAAETNGARLTVDIVQEPSPGRMPLHIHPRQRESFVIKAGTLTYVIGDRAPKTATAGEVVSVDPGTPHQWWNDGPETLRMVGDVTPAGHFLEFMETIYGLTRDGKVNRHGVPNPLQIGVIAWHFRHDWVPAFIPAPARLIAIPLLAAVGRLLGYRPTYPEYARHDRITPV